MSADAMVGLRALHADLEAVFAGLADADWQAPSGCEGWRVQDVLAHVTSNFKEIVDPTPPSHEPPPAMTAEEAMEALVAPRKEWTPAELLAEYERYRDGAFAALDAMQEEPMASVEAPVADLGTYQLHQLANAFCFDHYCHLHHDLLAPRGPLSADGLVMDDARVAPGIEWMFIGLPQMCSPAMAPVITEPLVIDLTGPGGGRWIIGPADADGLITVERSDDPAGSTGAATVESSAHDFVSWGTKRSDWRDACSLSGDVDYAARVLDAMNIV
ncbi:MAG: maleylpyruvate isomerase N-terminal domain-containing protein [Ilumatobacteraceae bacterium]